MSIFRKQNCKPVKSLSTTTVLALSAFFVGCEQTPITEATFSPSPGLHEEPQVVTIELPSNATNVYVTTNLIDPTPAESCSYTPGDQININRPTRVKLRYDLGEETFTQEGDYIIQSTIGDAGYINRDVINSWEDFFSTHVMPLFNPSMDENSTLTAYDETGGKVTLKTEILERTPFTNVPSKGKQSYAFSAYKWTDPDTRKSFNIHYGTVEGYMAKDEGGYYGTVELLPGDKNIVFSGTYNGYAAGYFYLDSDGITTFGEYLVYCSDPGCAEGDVVYRLDTNGDLIEFDSGVAEETWLCSGE